MNMPTATQSHTPEFVSILATDKAVFTMLERLAYQQQWWAPGRQWQRTFGRWHAEGTTRATLLYETEEKPQALCIVELFDAPPKTVSENQRITCADRSGWLRLTRFPDDAAMPGLPRVLVQHGGGHVLRYRPGKRCTIRFGGAIGQPVRFAKVFADKRGAQIHAESQALWEASQQGAFDFWVAQPLAWDADTNTLWQGAAPGEPILDSLLSVKGPALAARMGRAAASITHSSLQPARQFDGRAQLKRTRKYARQLANYLPSAQPLLERLVARLARAHEHVDAKRLRPLHGAPHAHQWLDDGRRLSLVDFDGFTLGDPELDAATFVTEMSFEDTAQVPVSAICDAFLNNYEAVAGPLDAALLDAYCLHKRISKALKYAYAIRTDGAARALAVLGESL